MVTGIILAGGESRRMKQNKMLLPFRGTFLLHHTVLGLAEVCDKIIIVRGHYKDDYLSSLQLDKEILMVDNNNYKLGMFSSVQCGVKKVQDSDVLVIPGDYPLVKHETYHQVVKGKGLLRVPTYQGRRGHPLFIDRTLVPQLLLEPISTNLKAFRNQFTIEHIEVDDPFILFDVDDMLEYQKLLDMERI